MAWAWFDEFHIKLFYILHLTSSHLTSTRQDKFPFHSCNSFNHDHCTYSTGLVDFHFHFRLAHSSYGRQVSRISLPHST